MNLPSDKVPGAGLEFNYDVWVPGTVVKLANVPWDSEYRDIVEFTSETAFINYVANLPGDNTEIGSMTYLRPGMPVNIPLPHTYVSQFNYILVRNPVMGHVLGDRQKAYGYFIDSVEFVAPGTTRVHLMLDVWSTYGPTTEFESVYVERGHVGQANTRAGADNGRRYLTVREPFDMGDMYRTMRVGEILTSEWDDDDPANQSAVAIVSSVDIQATLDAGDNDQTRVRSARGQMINGIPQGCDIYYVRNINDFRGVMSYLSSRPWITQGFLSVTMVPRLPESSLINPTTVGSHTIYQPIRYTPGSQTTVLSNWRQTVLAQIPERYRTLTKFLTFPYVFFELTAFNGKPLIIRPEKLRSWSLDIRSVNMFMPPSPRLVYYPMDYNAIGDGSGANVGETFDHATGITDMPQISVTNDGYLNYLAANRNSLAFSEQSADWAHQKAAQVAATSYDMANSGMQTQAQLEAAGRSARNRQAEIDMHHGQSSAAFNAAAGIGQGASMGAFAGPKGALVGGLGGAISGGIGMMGQNNANRHLMASTNAANDASRRAQAIQQAGAIQDRDANNKLALFAAKGDYENAIAGIQARVQDAQMTPPSVSGQLGGDALQMMLNNGIKMFVNLRMIGQQPMREIGEHWLRYGYAVNERPNLDVQIRQGRRTMCPMSHFTYWKTRETYLRSAQCPETFRQVIRGIFEKGVTVWRNPADIGKRAIIGVNRPETSVRMEES